MRKMLVLLMAVTLCFVGVRSSHPAFAEEMDMTGAVDAEVMPAESAGDTGLIVDASDASSEAYADPAEATETPEAIFAPEMADVPEAVYAPEMVEAPEAPQADVEADASGILATEAAAGDPVDMVLSASELVLGVKESVALYASPIPEGSVNAVTWRSDKPKIAKVDATTGVVTAVKKGKTVIHVTTANGIEKTCNVTVMKAPGKIKLNTDNVVLTGTGQLFQLSATLPKKTGCQVYYETSDANVAVVDAAGLITTVNPGRATITARTFNGKTASCALRVLDPSVPGPAAILLAANQVTIGVKQSFALSPVFVAPDGSVLTDVEYTVASSSKKKLTVTADGVIKGVKKGNYTVTVTAYNGVSTTCAVSVLKAPSKVALSPKKPVLGIGQTRQMSVSFPKGGLASYTFSSSAPDIVSVDANGYVTGLQLGKATIKVRTSNGKTAKTVVTVTRGPEYVALNADYELDFDPLSNTYSTVYVKTLNPGESFQLSGENEYLTYGDLIAYESADPSIASVTSDGLITGISPGTTTIVAHSTNGTLTNCRVTVGGSLPASIAFVIGDAFLRAGQTIAMPKLSGSNVDAASLAAAAFYSSDASVLAVAWSDSDAEWKLCGVNPGTATVTATCAGATAQLFVTVIEAASGPAEVHFENATAYMSVGEQWKPTVYDEYGVSVDAVLTSDDPNVVSVDETGNLMGIGEGDATITATAGALTATMRVGVRAGAATLSLNAQTITLGVGQRFALTAQVNGSGSSSNLNFASSNAAVATVSGSGLIIARAPGTAIVTATAYGNISASCVVTVAPAPTKLAIEPASIEGRLDEIGTQLAWSFGAPDEVGDVTFSSADPRIATVGATGYVTFIAEGRTVVTGRTNSGMTASIGVTVLPAKAVSTTPTFRLFAAYSYFNTEYRGYLPFTRNNTESFANVFEHSSVSGLRYNTRVMGNPSKTQLLSGISGFFAGSTDADISIVYLCSHGHMTNGYGGYRMSLPGYDDNPNNANYYMTPQEIFNCIKRINGSVVLILDSCYSGAFLQDMQAQLDAQGGRIAVLTAASDTRATYYKVKNTNRSVDFFTFFLLKGLGYNPRDSWWNKNEKGKKGVYPGYLAADVAGNGDGIVTLGEFFNYASRSIAVNIPGYMKKSWYWGDPTRVQEPRFYAGNLNDLVIYQPQ